MYYDKIAVNLFLYKNLFYIQYFLLTIMFKEVKFSYDVEHCRLMHPLRKRCHFCGLFLI